MSRGSRFTAAVAAGLFATVVFTAPVAAQQASISAIATVAGGLAPLFVSNVTDLLFGTVTAGTNKTVTAPADVGRFDVSGQPSTPVLINFQLPLVLVQGANTIPINFGASDGKVYAVFPASPVTFDPHTVGYSWILPSTGNGSIGIGGTVSPPVGAVNGTYSGTITLTVSY